MMNLEWEAFDGRRDPGQRYALYRLCECGECGGKGKTLEEPFRCSQCRGEGRTLQLLATCATEAAVGVSLVTLAREGEWEECPLGVLDRQGEPGQKWLVRPWLPSARNVSDAGRTLRASRQA
jgi:hypothetical protein